MTLPGTLAEILAMGRDALGAILRFYVPRMRLQPWNITARWVAADPKTSAAGWCTPNPIYKHATISIVWPPIGDVEETIVHELAHCARAMLGALAGAYEEGTWARAEFESDAEQTARCMVELRRGGDSDSLALTRFCRSTFTAFRRENMDPKLVELVMKAGEMSARDDVPDDVRQLLAAFVAALASNGAGEAEPMAAAAEDPDAAPMAEMPADDDKAPAYMRALSTQVKDLAAIVARIAPAPSAAAPAAATPSPELVEARRLSVETFLSTKPGLVSSEAERQLVARGDISLARFVVAEVERRPAQRNGAKPPNGGDPPAPQLNDFQKAAARRHKVTEAQYAAQLQRQAGQQRMLGRGGK